MAIAKSNLGRLRQAVFHTAETAAKATGIPVRSIRNYESGGGTAPRFKKERVEYANWLLSEAKRLQLPDIPTLAELVPDVYGIGQEEEKAGALTPAHTVKEHVTCNLHDNYTTATRRVKLNGSRNGIPTAGVPND